MQLLQFQRREVSKQMKLPKYLSYKNLANDEAEIAIDGEITSYPWADGDQSASGFRDVLKDLGDVKHIDLHLNSPGGDVFEGVAIYNMLKQNKADVDVYVDGLAASIASVIAMAGKIHIPQNAALMIHNPYAMWVTGNANDLRKEADTLDKVGKSILDTYTAHVDGKTSREDLQAMMDDETWLYGDEAVEAGLADELLGPVQAAACLDAKFANKYKHAPKNLIKPIDSASKQDDEWRNDLIKKIKSEQEILSNKL